jgi:hypothetical protein
MAVDECHHSSGRRGSRKNNMIIHYTVRYNAAPCRTRSPPPTCRRRQAHAATPRHPAALEQPQVRACPRAPPTHYREDTRVEGAYRAPVPPRASNDALRVRDHPGQQQPCRMPPPPLPPPTKQEHPARDAHLIPPTQRQPRQPTKAKAELHSEKWEGAGVRGAREAVGQVGDSMPPSCSSSSRAGHGRSTT